MRPPRSPEPSAGALHAGRGAQAVVVAVLLGLLLAAGPGLTGRAWAQQQGGEAPVQILTSDLARVQTVRQEHIAATFVVIGAHPIREVRINGKPETIHPDMVVVVNAQVPLPARENLIDVTAVDVNGNRREKSFLVVREGIPQPPTPAERQANIAQAIDRGDFERARIELTLWRQQGGPSVLIDPLMDQLQERETVAESQTILALIDAGEFDQAQRRLAAWQSIGGDYITISGLEKQLAATKLQVLKPELEGAIVAGHFDEADTILKGWEAAGDNPDAVASLRKVWTEWKSAPPYIVDVQGIPRKTQVRLQVRSLAGGASGMIPAQGPSASEIKTLGEGPGRYQLPGPGAYTLEFVNDGVHEPLSVPLKTALQHTEVTLAPDLTYQLQGKWEVATPMPVPDAAPGVVVRQGKVHVFGGYQSFQYARERAGGQYGPPRDKSVYAPAGTMAVFDPDAGTWNPSALPASTVPQLPFQFSAAALPDVTLLVTAKSSLWHFSADWQQHRVMNAPLPVLAGRPTTVAYKGQVYAFGGLRIPDQPSTSAEVQPVPLAKALRYDPAKDAWTELSPMPAPRGGAVAAAVGDYIYVIGGLDKNGDFRSEVFRYDPAHDHWESARLANMPTGRAWAVAAVVNHEIYVIGGEGSGFFGSKALDSVQVFNPEAGRWHDGPDLPTARKDAGVAVVAGRIYVIGGYGEKSLATVEVLR